MSRFFIRWSSVDIVSNALVKDDDGSHTMKFSNIHAELIALLQDTPTTVLDERIKARSELVHATAQVVEAKVD